jgi:lipopolysaccharide/colanic/teichoic acid biosynthesis glycosyltransferase
MRRALSGALDGTAADVLACTSAVAQPIVLPELDAAHADALPELPRRARLLKRSLDIAGSSLGLAVLAPALALIAIAVRRTSPGPAIYRQIRSGADGALFRIYKFRTMSEDADARLADIMHLNLHARDFGDGRLYKIAADPRVTRFGAFLRRFSLDELPQLLNVLTGDMSLVGPRPLTRTEDQHVVGWARTRARVRPGITGPWQVLGRNEIPFDEMMRLDYAYVAEWSFIRDVELLARTIPAALRGEPAR